MTAATLAMQMATSTDRSIVISRVINAPRALVFEAWTDPVHIGNWWGPSGFTTTTTTRDVRPGGIWRFMMHGPDGTDYPNKILYREIVRPSRLSYLHTSDDDSDPGFEVTVTFEEHDAGRTALTLTSLFATADIRDKVVREFHAIEGGNQTIDRLEAYLRGEAP